MKLVQALKDCAPVYLISPYTTYWRGHCGAYIDISKLGSKIFLKHRIVTFSPIGHGHGMAAHGDMPKVSPKLWKEFNQPFVDLFDAALVAKLDGWDVSAGSNDEIGDFRGAKKMIAFVHPETLELTLG